ncbi:LysR family transcriptional regulator [Ectothiorhodospiraceae bacterium 2226]|nr:LysR family transcriptional regulator [Ectothiorhodospiraceae bacterium 2226]
MDIEQIKTFLAIAANGSFLEAANRLHVTQSTVSARVQNLEAYLGARLFVRNRSGAALTPAGKRFLRHAKSLVLTLEQARHDVGLPTRFRARIRMGARIALWEGFLPQWVSEMRRSAPDVSISSEIGFEEDLMRRLVEGTLDIGLMYTPQQSPGLQVEHLFDETLVLLTTAPGRPWPDEDYVYIDWGAAFYAQHSNRYPDLERPALTADIGWLGVQLILQHGGSCFLPLRMTRHLIDSETLFPVADSPRFQLPAYMVYPRESDSAVLAQAVAGLRALAAIERAA